MLLIHLVFDYLGHLLEFERERERVEEGGEGEEEGGVGSKIKGKGVSERLNTEINDKNNSISVLFNSSGMH